METEEEAEDLAEANSDSDPEIRSSGDDTDIYDGIQSLMSDADTESDPDGEFKLSEGEEEAEWQQEQEDATQMIDPEFIHMLDDGLSVAAISDLGHVVALSQFVCLSTPDPRLDPSDDLESRKRIRQSQIRFQQLVNIRFCQNRGHQSAVQLHAGCGFDHGANL